MPRAHRHYIPGCVWHITHRCHKQELLLKFDKDKKCWLRWLFEAKKRYGLSVLNYIVTSNHIHLLVVDTAKHIIPKSLQLMAGRTAQEFNIRKNRKGAFWEDRYHATAVQGDEHLAKCLVYIDLNMVRAGVVDHPSKFKYSGFNEIQQPPVRYAILDRKALLENFSIHSQERFQLEHLQWVEAELATSDNRRKKFWSDSVAVGNKGFVNNVRQQLGLRAKGRCIITQGEGSVLKEVEVPYEILLDVEKSSLSPPNRYFWDS